MKKTIIAAALFLSTGILVSCSKQATFKPLAVVELNSEPPKKDIGIAD